MLLQDLIYEKLAVSFVGAKISVLDTLGDQNHWKVIIESRDFQGKSSLERHRMVYAALEEDLKSRIHALSIETHLPQ